MEAGLLADEAERDNEAWLLSVRHGRPFVTWKYAASLDGRSAAADGTSNWITSEQSRADVHRLRAHADAVVAGIGTVLADDPRLTTRTAAVPRQPLRIVLDSDGRTPAGAAVLGAGCPDSRRRGLRADLAGHRGRAVTRGTDGRIDLRQALKQLDARGLRHLFLEGGPTLAGAFLQADLVDRVVGYIAPQLLGAGRPALGDAAVTTLAEAYRFRFDDIESIGPDVRIVARPVREGI